MCGKELPYKTTIELVIYQGNPALIINYVVDNRREGYLRICVLTHLRFLSFISLILLNLPPHFHMDYDIF